MNIYSYYRAIIVTMIGELAAAGECPPIEPTGITVEPPRDPAHGDIATNAALALAKDAGRPPRDIAAKLAAKLATAPDVAEATVAGPGFVNLRLSDRAWQARLRDVLATGLAYGDSAIGEGRRVNVEYVSANPTGPLHVGHGRGAVYGDALANLLQKAGFAVTREYYINDAGAQIDALAQSHYLRLRERAGETIDPAAFEGLYPGEYVKASAADAARFPQSFIGNLPSGVEFHLLPAASSERIRDGAIESMMQLIRGDLDLLGVRHDVFTSERELHRSGEVQAAVTELESRGLVYTGQLEPPKGKKLEDWEPRPQLLFRATRFNDDVDRPLQKSDGSWTYFASDIAYHYDKFQRGFAAMIDVWGADHAGYVKRVKAAVKALTDGKAELDVRVCQLVNLLDGGQPVKMSKRAGKFATLREVIDEVGPDVVRFIMLTRKNDAQLDFDLQKVTEQSKDNPVFYVQYAHARAHSAMRGAAAAFPETAMNEAALAAADLARLTHPAELGLIKSIAGWPRAVETAADAHEPHRVAFYLYDLAAAFHALWTLGKDDPRLRFIVADDKATTLARMALVRALAVVIASGLTVMGVKPLEEMH